MISDIFYGACSSNTPRDLKIIFHNNFLLEDCESRGGASVEFIGSVVFEF